jgi:hypothetical protein
MPRSSSALLSSPKLSTLILCILIFSTLSSMSAFAQVSRKQMLPAEGNDQDQQRKRAEWNMRGREAPKGESAAALRLRAHQQKMAMRAQREAAARAAGAVFSPQVTTWLNLGPAPLASDATGNGSQDYNWVSGRATSVLVDPADTTGNTILLGGAYGGLWKSTDAGSKSATPNLVTWQALIDDQPSLAVGAIALQPGNSNLILVGTGETNASGDSYYGMGILRSTDGGTTWTQITSAVSSQSFVGVGFSKIAFSTSNTNLVVASTAGDIGFDFGLEQDANSTARGLYYSTDAGATWNRVTLSDSAVPASATGVVYNATQGAFYAAIRRHGIYSSTDGQHFTRLATQPTAGLASANCPANQNSTNCQIYRAEFAVTPGRNEMYVWVFDLSPTTGETDDGIWRTTNGGSAWTQIPDNGITNCGSGGGGEGPGGSGFGCGVEQGAYNLEIAAIPDSAGTGTDVYAGTINIHKCHLASGASSCSTIDTNVPTDWINLTHVYGCAPVLGELAHVHPDQHGLGFLVVGSKAPGYFAHDGGISRTLDGYADLKSGTCTTPNQFDSLSQTLGSMTEFVSFSVHPTSADILLGGTQDNGSPKTSTATTGTQWQNALSGDGGFNAINPVNVNEWFTSNPFSEILKCQLGTSCDDTHQFYVASPDILANIDFGAFYTPYILDPQNSAEMLIGTCRMWRGDTATGTNNPGTFNILSNRFDTGDTLACSGGEINQVAGLAAGGPKDASGFSNVVYATTWGYGPLANIGGGEVWVTTNAGAATPAMTNVTGSINPNHYAISSVAIDTSVANGQTAYVGIMGFSTPAHPTSHVWKTANAGTTWTDWTGSGGTALPDAPVSALLVDSSTGLIYAGTDVGVFSSPTTGAGGVWTEVGPVAGPGSGFLPSAPVTAIQIFKNGTTKDLRVSTYGRGIWDFSLTVNPSFTLSAAPSSLSITPGGAAGTSTITVIPAGGFTGSVSLAASGLPSGVTASFNPTSTTTTSVLSLTASSSATAGTATVTITGTSGSLTATTTIALTITGPPNFTLSAAPSSLSIASGGAAGTSTITVNDQNGFTGSVSLVASGLPSGVTASFNPTSTTTTSVLTLTASGSASAGTSTVTITGTSGSLTATTTIALTVTGATTTTTALTSSASSIPSGASVTFTATVTGASPTGTVTFKNGAATLGTGSLSAGVATLKTTALVTIGTDSITAVYAGDANNLPSTSSALTETVTAAIFTISATPATQTISSGGTATVTVTVTPQGIYTSPITFTAALTPTSTAQVTFNPTTVTPNGSTATTTLTITGATSGPQQAANGGTKSSALNASLLWTPIGLAGLFFLGRRKKSDWRVVRHFMLAAALALIALTMFGCGGSSSHPTQTYQVKITATGAASGNSGAVTTSTTVAFTAQ